MSREGRDSTYKPTKSTTQKERTGPRQAAKRNTKRIDYTEVEVIVSGSDTDKTLTDSESGFSSVKLEPVEKGARVQREGLRDTWTPNTFRHKATQVTQQFVRISETNTELVMARESEKTSVETLMEMMISMQVEEKKREQARERQEEEREERRGRERREEKAERRELEAKRQEAQLAREERLLVSLKAAQPVVPQKVTISSNRLPLMKPGDDIEVFIPQVSGALVAMNIPAVEWKGHIYSQVTTEEKDDVMLMKQLHMRK